MISCYRNIYSPEVIDEIDIYDFLERISNPDRDTFWEIKRARILKMKGNDSGYKEIKTSLPCYTLNFSFQGIKSNNTIKAATGLIYLDVDKVATIDYTHPLVLAGWRSVSGAGYGLLVKVEGLTLKNFKTNYFLISKELGITVDPGAAKSTQYTIQSYDKDLYLNNDSTTWEATTTITPTSITTINKKKGVGTEMGENDPWRYDNINDFDFKNQEYLEYPKEKIRISTVYFPKEIREGNRNSLLFAKGAQLRALNPSKSNLRFLKYMHGINNNCCTPPLPNDEIESIVRSILQMEEPQAVLNKERRVLFPKNSNLSASERRSRTNKVTGRRRSERTRALLASAVYWWDYLENGRLTQKKLAKVTGKNIKTIEKYYKDVKDI